MPLDGGAQVFICARLIAANQRAGFSSSRTLPAALSGPKRGQLNFRLININYISIVAFSDKISRPSQNRPA